MTARLRRPATRLAGRLWVLMAVAGAHGPCLDHQGSVVHRPVSKRLQPQTRMSGMDQQAAGARRSQGRAQGRGAGSAVSAVVSCSTSGGRSSSTTPQTTAWSTSARPWARRSRKAMTSRAPRKAATVAQAQAMREAGMSRVRLGEILGCDQEEVRRSLPAPPSAFRGARTTQDVLENARHSRHTPHRHLGPLSSGDVSPGDIGPAAPARSSELARWTPRHMAAGALRHGPPGARGRATGVPSLTLGHDCPRLGV